MLDRREAKVTKTQQSKVDNIVRTNTRDIAGLLGPTLQKCVVHDKEEYVLVEIKDMLTHYPKGEVLNVAQVDPQGHIKWDKSIGKGRHG